MKPSLFVTGTDTNVGKTLLSALLVAALDAIYWKPIQTGACEGTDRRTVIHLAQIPEAQVSRLSQGSSVEAQATAWPGQTFKGRVIALLPQIDSQTRTLTIRVALDNLGSRLSPGMWVTLNFTAPAREPQLVVPNEAVIVTGERSVVIVACEGGSFNLVNVTTGVEQDGQTPILSGLQEGQSIVLSGQFLIDSEASLTATMNRLQSAP